MKIKSLKSSKIYGNHNSLSLWANYALACTTAVTYSIPAGRLVAGLWLAIASCQAPQLAFTTIVNNGG